MTNGCCSNHTSKLRDIDTDMDQIAEPLLTPTRQRHLGRSGMTLKLLVDYGNTVRIIIDTKGIETLEQHKYKAGRRKHPIRDDSLYPNDRIDRQRYPSDSDFEADRGSHHCDDPA
jgi:hypothetical protein